MSLIQHINHLCVINGDYKILKKELKNDGNDNPQNGMDKLNELIEFYKINLQQQGQDECFQLIHSRDGNELYTSLLNSFGLNSIATNDLDKTISNLNEILSLNSAPGAQQYQRLAIQHLNNNNNNSSSYICFIISDFDQSDSIFLKLEETQLKLTNFINSINGAQAANLTSNTSSAHLLSTSNMSILQANQSSSHQKRFMIFGWPVLYYCIKNDLCLTMATDVERPLYCKLMSGCYVCFTGFRKENKNSVAYCIKLVHYMGGSVRKEYNKRITHLIVKSTLSTKYKTAYNIGKCHLLTEDWITEAWKHRNQVDFDVNGEDFLKKFRLKALYSLSIAFYGFTQEETQHMKEVTIENGGTPISDLNDPNITHIVINDQEVRHFPDEPNLSNSLGSITPTTTGAKASHIFIDLNQSPFSNTRASIVRAEWFWASIQICCRASECLYEFTKTSRDINKNDPPNKRIKLSVDNLLSNELNSTAHMTMNLSQTDSPHNNKKLSPQRAQQNNTLNEFDSPTLCPQQITNKSLTRLSTDRLLNGKQNMSNNLSTSASLLDATTDDAMSIDSPFNKDRDNHGLLNSASSNGAQTEKNKKMSKRSQRIIELYETEKRFVNILHTIICYFKEPIEAPDQVAGPILDQTESKEIFGNLPPIYEVHCKIKERLERIVNRNINEDSVSVGEIYFENSDALLKTYPPFVNFYEKTKDAIQTNDKMKPRFHAFLKIAQSKPECGRQTLTELLIRPVQRLPSTLLLLDDILKETPKTHRDHELLSKAIASLKEVMTHINEDKRKIENQLTMFVLMNDIENCPANLLSSHRHFLKKLYVYEMSNELLKKGAQLALFLFSDCLEICKPRFKLHNAKSPSLTSSSKQRSPTKLYKHIALFSLNNVTKVCDILQNGDDTDLFGILCRLAGEKDKFFSFKVIPNASNQSNNSSIVTNHYSTISSQSSNSSNSSSIYCSTTNLNLYDEHAQAQLEKKDFIKLLAQGICNVKCITEYENILCTIEAKQLQIDLNESGSKKLEAVKSYARIINRRVSRAFSFSQDTPNKIKKTISSVFRSPFQSSYSQQSLNEQKASKLASLASLQLTPTLQETKRKFITMQKSREAVMTHTQLFRQQTCSNITTQTTSSLLSLDTCLSSTSENDLTTSDYICNKKDEKRLGQSQSTFPDITNIFQNNGHKRQLT
ncbi:unnamed protein product [Brachionus calyciflorus]|uniref:ECT2 n=1 Tax=Brachionus calyciflorus TaxID=104777 RepID=A0A813Y1F1_9BILA|nr:unnamed protein product [Brachionus calyciflorus]